MVEVIEMTSTTAEKTIVELRRVFATHPSSNGAVERFVQTFKIVIRAGERDALPLPR